MVISTEVGNQSPINISLEGTAYPATALFVQQIHRAPEGTNQMVGAICCYTFRDQSLVALVGCLAALGPPQCFARFVPQTGHACCCMEEPWEEPFGQNTRDVANEPSPHDHRGCAEEPWEEPFDQNTRDVGNEPLPHDCRAKAAVAAVEACFGPRDLDWVVCVV